MSKKVFYSVKGFDCPHCAAKAELHIEKQYGVKGVKFDFEKGVMMIKFKEEGWDVAKLASVIAEVEKDPLEISLIEEK